MSETTKIKKPDPVDVWIGNDEYSVYWSQEMDAYIELLSKSIKTAFEDYNHFKINTFDNLRETIFKILEQSSGVTQA